MAYHQPYPQHQPYPPQYGSVQPHHLHPARGTATAALWFAVIGFLCFPILPSVIALVLAGSARRAGYPGGRARVASVLAWIALLLALVGVGLELLFPGLLTR